MSTLVLEQGEQSFQFDITFCSDDQLDQLDKIQQVEMDEEEGVCWVNQSDMNIDLFNQLEQLNCELENGWVE